MGRAEDITSFIKRYDRELYCERDREGKLLIYRKGVSVESYDFDGAVLHYVRSTPYLVLALTDTWNLNGNPRDWGCLPILAKLKSMDLWQRDLATESINSIRKVSESRERSIDNHIESYLLENRRAFAKATNDLNVSTLIKKTGS